MDLIKMITAKFEELETTGKLNDIIEKHVTSCADSIVHDCFRWSGEGEKAIKEALKGKLGVDLESVKIPQYNKIVADIVNKQLDKTVTEDVRKEIIDTCNKVTGVLEKKEYKLSEIIEQFVESLDKSYDGEMDDQCGEMTLHVDNDGTFAHIYFDKEEGKAKHECASNMFLYEGKLSGVTTENRPFSPFEIRTMDTFEKFMFKLYCSNVSITIDENDCELDYYREDYD